jgi:hypothetical protein
MESNLRLKVGALASSLLLGAVFVSFRAGAIDPSSRSNRSAIQTPPVPAYPTVVVPPRTDVNPPAAPVAAPQIFYGSKSAAVFVAPQPTSEPAPQQTTSPAQPSRQSAVIMSGSKSLMPAAPRQEAVQALQQAGGR